MMTARFEKRDFKRGFMLLDVLVLGVFAIALMVLVRDAYVAGFYEQRSAMDQTRYFWYMLRDTIFLVASMAWFFFRYFRDKIAALQNPWA